MSLVNRETEAEGEEAKEEVGRGGGSRGCGGRERGS